MLKRKYGNRSDWKRVLESDYCQIFHDDEDFRGYITLLNIIEVREPLVVSIRKSKVCIANNGYSWLQHFPIGKNHAITTMFDDKDEIVQTYIDICYKIGIENNIPWMDDLFLDIVVFPTGEIILLDEDELEEALSIGVINQSMYDLAWKEARKIIDLIHKGEFDIIHLANAHRNIVKKINSD